jgi:predicted RNase H-like HicB family nuclease
MALRHFTLEYWTDEGWYVGRLKEVPGIFSQGKTLEELEDNILDAYRLMVEDEMESLPIHIKIQTKEIGVEV